MIAAVKNIVACVIQWLRVKALCAQTGICSRSTHISVHAKYGKYVRIGKDVHITEDVELGDSSYVNRNSTLENCQVGKYCSISEGVRINPIEHNLNLVTTHPIAGANGHYGQRNERVIIGNDVLISLNAIILSGVKIGNGAVVGAGAVVTKDVPPYAVVAGVPAKVIRYRLPQEQIELLETIQWWDWPLEKIRKNIAFLRNETMQIVE